MINDSNLMFWENCEVTVNGNGTVTVDGNGTVNGTVTVDGDGTVNGTVNGTGTGDGTGPVVNGWHHVPLTGFLEPGRQGPIPISIIINDATSAPESLTFKLYQYDAAYKEEEGGEGGEEIAEFKVEKDQIVKGARIGWRFLPRSVTKNWLGLGFEAEAGAEGEADFTFTFTAAIVREDLFDYSPDLLINAGRNEYGKIQALKKKSS